MSVVDRLAAEILQALMADFKEKALSATALKDGYVGISFEVLRQRFAQDSAVDFDLAMSSLEKGLVETGPREAFDNEPGSAIIVFGFFSKREYVYLTEAGYRQAQKDAAPPETPIARQHVQISGSTFYQSPVGVGSEVSQSLTVNIQNEAEVIRYLTDLANAERTENDDPTADVTELVAAAKTGDLAKGKSVFQKLFGAASEGVKQVAWGVVSALIAQQMGL
jgi:hypothetical protein